MFPSNAKILIVDDSTFARASIKTALNQLKYMKVVEAGDVKAAQRQLVKEDQPKDPVTLIITDLGLPEEHGLEFVRWLRAHEKYKNIPVIVITSSQEKAEILEAGRIGVSHYMIKPFEVATLREKVASTWKKHGEKYLESLKTI